MSRVSELVAEWRKIGPSAWAEGPYGWIGLDSRPIVLEPWQRAVLAAWEAHRGEITTLGVSNVKKVGKTFLNAVLLAWRWLSLPGEHFAVGNDLDQSAGRQFQQIAEMIRRHPYLRTAVRMTGRQLEFTPTGSTITALPVDAAGNAGANHLTASHTESWGIIHEAGIRAYEELTPPPGRFYGLPALRIADSYGGYETESQSWHALVDRGLAGERVSEEWPIYQHGGLLLFHAEGEEAQERCFRGNRAEREAYYLDQRAQLREGAYRRLHLNQRTSGAEAFITAEQWDACVDPTLTPLAPTPDIPVFVGLDLATRGDDCGVVALCGDGPGRARVAFHAVWRTSKRDPLSLDAVKNYLKAKANEYRIGGIFYDPSQAYLLAEQLSQAGLRMIEVKQTLGELGPRGMQMFEAVRDRRLRVYADDDLRRAALNATAREVSTGLHLVKSGRQRKIDLLVALSFALPAALDSGQSITAEELAKLVSDTWAPSRWATQYDDPGMAAFWRNTRESRFGRRGENY